MLSTFYLFLISYLVYLLQVITLKEHKHYGSYALIIKDDKIVLIKKKTGPYDGKLDFL